MDLIARAKARRSELTKIAEAAQAEMRKIDRFLAEAAELDRMIEKPGSRQLATLTDAAVGASEKGDLSKDYANTRGKRTGELLDVVFSTKEKIHYTELPDRMIALGWRGSGDRSRDARSLHSLLTVKKNKYRRVGKGYFERVR